MPPTSRRVSDLFDLYRSVGMETAMQLEEEFTDEELGLVAQSTNNGGYPQLD